MNKFSKIGIPKTPAQACMTSEPGLKDSEEKQKKRTRTFQAYRSDQGSRLNSDTQKRTTTF